MKNPIPIVLYRTTLTEEEEGVASIKKHFDAVDQRTNIPSNRLVVGRYSVLPFYKELEQDILNVGSELINTYKQHRYIADLTNWYEDLKDLTPRTWTRMEDIDRDGPFVLKGLTNSRKFLWNTHMYASDKDAAMRVYLRLTEDPMIDSQGICIREYVPLKQLGTNIHGHGLPITDEYRFFICDGEILSRGFYWANCDVDELSEKPDAQWIPDDFLQEVIDRVGSKARFWVLDVARTASNKWTVIELNDGQMSGLSDNDPDIMYGRLKEVLSC